MKIEKINVEGFRAFNKPYEFTFNEKLTVILGPNGTGKTSLCDAIEWALLGKLPQYDSAEAEQEDTIINRDSLNREARVAISFRKGKSKTKIVRSVASSKVWKPTRSAKLKILEGDKIEIAPETFRATVYLRQEALREFIQAKPEKRGPVLSSLLGIEFIVALENGVKEAEKLIEGDKKSLKDDIDGKRGELNKYWEECESLSSQKTSLKEKMNLTQKEFENELKVSSIISRAKDLFEKLEKIGDIINLKMPVIFKEDLMTVRAFLDKLPSMHLEWKQKISSELSQYKERKRRIEELERKIEEFDESVINQKIKGLQEKIKLKEKALEVKDSYSKVLISGKEYLQLAMPNECPLCESRIDASTTLNRVSIKVEELKEKKEIEALYEEIKKLKQEERNLSLKLDNLRSWRQEKEELEKNFDQEKYEKLESAKSEYEALETEATILVELYNIFKKEQELAQRYPQLPSEDDIKNDEMKLEKLTRFHEFVKTLNEHFSRISPLFIQKRIESLNPIISDYAKILAPHPTFSKISIIYNEHGYWLQGVSETGEKTYVQTLFSTGQLNESAVLILLAMAKKAPHKLEFVIMDDPSQSLDSYGKRRLAELLAKASQDKQIIVSTMDSEFANYIKSTYPQAAFIKFLEYKKGEGPVVENVS
ncbi:MAG: AAA family ATPase [Candidatus Bathyarchaeia archaeon]